MDGAAGAVNAARDHFPRTPRTVVFESLDEGRAHEVVGGLMALYAEPLEIYFAATSFRGLGEPRDIVAGFFSSRMAQPRWLADWRARHEIDQIPLRRWLLTSLNFYLHEEVRRRDRDRRDGTVAADFGTAPTAPPSAERAFERESARSIVGLALERTREACAAAGQARHLEVFMRHFMHQVPYEQLARELAASEGQCAGMSRTVAAKLRRELAAILLEEGVEPDRLNEEIARLLEVLGP